MILYSVDIMDFNTCSTVSPTSSHIQPQAIDPKERRRQQDRERYANMESNKKKHCWKDNVKPIKKQNHRQVKFAPDQSKLYIRCM